MALWEKCQQLTGPHLEELMKLYGAHFPIEVRHYLAQWIENQPWNSVNPEDAGQYPQAFQFYEGLLQALRDIQMRKSDDFITRTQLEGLYIHMKLFYASKPLELVKFVQNCLYKENELVEKMFRMSNGGEKVAGPGQQGPEKEIQRKLDNLKQLSDNIRISLNQLLQQNETLNLLYNELAKQRNSQNPQSAEEGARIRKLETHWSVEQDTMKKKLEEVSTKCRTILDEIGQAQQKVLDDVLEDLKTKQKHYKNEEGFQTKKLNQIQQWCEILAEVNWQLCHPLKQLETLYQNAMMSQHGQMHTASPSPQQMHQYAVRLLVTLVKKCFVLEREPPQVLKTANRFSATVRMLVGNKLNFHMSPPEVVVSIINEQQARQVHGEPEKRCDASMNSGELLNYKKTMELQPSTGVLACTFNSMQLKKIKRSPERRGNESVMEEKFTLLFQTQVNIGGEINVNIKVMSLPVVVIVHGNQQPQAEFTIFWDNSFAEPNRNPFQTPDLVDWPKLAEALKAFFASTTGRGLTPGNLNYLAHKLIPSLGHDEDPSNYKVGRQAVGKDTLKGVMFTFWSWFYQARELVVTCFKKEWEAGLIEGFIDKNEAHTKLAQCVPGTFLMRFSDSGIGGISIAYTRNVDTIVGSEVYSVQPWTKNDLQHVRPFSARIRDLEELLYLYPCVLKNEAFAKFYPQPIDESADPAKYVGCTVVVSLHPPGSSRTNTEASMSLPPSSPMIRPDSIGQPSPMPQYGLHNQPSPLQPFGNEHEEFPQPPGAQGLFNSTFDGRSLYH